jgi:Mn2+/Fe2+ NRAMP family transporter
MKILRRINLSAAVIVLICFFLSWVQVSCAGARDTMGGLDLARNGHGLLWFVPVLMVALVLSTILRRDKSQTRLSRLRALCVV